MRKRPIGPLVKSLIKYGCSLEDKEYLPIKIKPIKFYNITDGFNTITVDGSLSSQYVTGILFAFCMQKSINKNDNYKIIITGEDTSCGFIDMTLSLLENFGFSFDILNREIIIIDVKNTISEYIVEGDATTASYLFGWSYINKFDIKINNLKLDSSQPDMNVLRKMLKYFGDLILDVDSLIFKPYQEIKYENELCFDLDSSDTFLTWAVLFASEYKIFEITNIKNQNWKECPRIDKFIENIEKLNGKCVKTDSGFKMIKEIEDNLEHIVIRTYNDHRLAMSFSLLSMKFDNILIENPHCVNKTYPKYWEDMKRLNIKIYPKDNYKYNTITLIGMPGSGKSTLANEIEDKLGIRNIDTDKVITADVGGIKEFIKKYSWESFRDLECKHIFNSISDNYFKVISTGGGVIESPCSRNIMENSLIIWIKREEDVDDTKKRELEDSYENLKIRRNNIYESLSDYVYINDKTPYDFIKWLRLTLFSSPIPNNSIFLCKTDEKYESNISNLIELRGDISSNNFYNLDKIQDMMVNFGKPCIYTLRSKDEGGNFEGSEQEYEKIIKKAIKLGVKMIDFELSKKINIDLDIETIGSIHSDNIEYITKNINDNFCHDILKIVTSVPNCQILEKSNLAKNTILVDNKSNDFRVKNKYMTPVSSIVNQATAPNQLNYLNYLDRCFELDGKKFLFLFGSNIGESPSSFIHNKVITKFQENIVYLNFESDNIDNIIDLINKPYFKGASVTMPYKEEVISYFKEKNDIDAINTIIKNEDSIEFSNTDSLALEYFINDNKVFILGTGGAAIGALEATKGRDVTIVGRNEEKLKLLSGKYKVKYIKLDDFSKPKNFYQVINCLPPTVSIDRFLSDKCSLIDMTYGIHNLDKDSLSTVYSELCNMVNGYDILYVQAAYQYMEWFGDEIEFDKILMQYNKAINEFLDNKYLNNI